MKWNILFYDKESSGVEIRCDFGHAICGLSAQDRYKSLYIKTDVKFLIRDRIRLQIGYKPMYRSNYSNKNFI